MATVLALDKDALQLELLSFLLKQQGHRVYGTPEPDTALDLLQSKLIDLVIIETSLHRHDGFRVCQQIRQLNPFTPLMIVSGRHEEDQIVRGLMLAADDYMTKPFSPRLLLARVHALQPQRQMAGREPVDRRDRPKPAADAGGGEWAPHPAHTAGAVASPCVDGEHRTGAQPRSADAGCLGRYLRRHRQDG